LADFRANIRAAVDIDEIAPKKAVISALVQDVDVRSRNEIYPTFRFPTAAELDGKVRKLSGSVHSTCHNPNTPPSAFPLVNGPLIRVPGQHGKVRRDGYRRTS